MVSRKRTFGNIGESAAQVFLMKHGYKIVETNFSKPYGEIDIIAVRKNIIRFIEVKTSKFYRETSFTPEMRVNKNKAKRLKRVCETYIHQKDLPDDQEWQIDVISVILNDDNTVQEIKHFENAVFGRQY